MIDNPLLDHCPVCGRRDDNHLYDNRHWANATLTPENDSPDLRQADEWLQMSLTDIADDIVNIYTTLPRLWAAREIYRRNSIWSWCGEIICLLQDIRLTYGVESSQWLEAMYAGWEMAIREHC